MVHDEITKKPIDRREVSPAPMVYHNRDVYGLLSSGTYGGFTRFVLSGMLIKADVTPVKTMQEED